MKQSVIIKIFFSILIIVGGAVQGQTGYHKRSLKTEKRVTPHHNHHHNKKLRATKRYKRSRVVVVKKRRGRTLSVLPKGVVKIHHNKLDYHYHAGRFYRPNASRYAVIIPPRGLRIKSLSPKAHRFMWKNRNYFYHYGTYYIKKDQDFESVRAEEGMIVPSLPSELVEEISIDDQNYFELDNVIYQRVEEGYKVVGELED